MLVAVGTAENDVRDCNGTMSGPASGPRQGDLGDWIASVKGGSGSSGGQGQSQGQSSGGQDNTAGSSGNSGDESSQCVLECLGDEIEFDEQNCACICPPGLITCVAEIGSIPAKGGVIFNAQPVTVPTGYCVDPSSDVSNCGTCGNFCTGDVGANIASCNAGVCNYTCKDGFAQCGGDPAAPCTTDLMSDNNNCGACGYVCPGNLSCNNGLCTCLLACIDPQDLDFNNCVCNCPGGLAVCGGGCVDLITDSNNCGACGNVCGPIAPFCQAGKCEALASQ